ncbi:hypothetical protein C8P66_1069 [Humitalea rosea]|uniref:AsmA domain-containing protein n=1 Tax=Humitalea rosea TaxID=990373 RepID=A0A2W7KJ94_9PROT|nr:AsmA family protein [Humitalea rosea]PZW48006.1 hypothetical protein C8P66_1069 [Humitalea rosea]
MAIPRGFRWLAWIGGPILALLLLFRWDWFIPLVEARAAAAIGRPVSIEHLHLRLGRVTEITLTEVLVGNPPGFEAETPFAHLPTAVVAVELWPLLRHRTAILPSIALDQPEFRVLAHEDGSDNFTFPAEAGGEGPQIGRLAITGGKAQVTIPRLQADFALQIATAEPAGQDPSLTVSAEGTYAGQPITGELVGGALLNLRDRQAPWPVRLSLANGPTQVTMAGSVQDPLAMTGADLRLELKGPDMALLTPLTGVPIPPTPAYRIAGQLDFAPGRVRFREIDGMVGRTDLEGEVIIAPRAARPEAEMPPAAAPNATAAPPADTTPRPDITLNLQSRLVDLADLSGFIGGAPAEGAAPAAPAGRTLPATPVSIPRLRAADVHLTYRGAKIEGRNMPLDDLRAEMDIIDGIIRLHPVSFGVGEGRMSAEGVLTPREDGALHAEVEVQFSRLSVSRLLGATGIAQGAGTLGGRARITSTGKSTAELLAHGDGELTLSMAGGTISALLVDLSGVRLGNAILSALGIPSRTQVECFVADFGLRRGVLTSRTVLLDTSEAVIAGTGTVDLGRERLDYQLRTEAKHLTIAALPTSILIRGSFANPSVAPEIVELGVRGGIAAALGIVALPLALLPTIQLGIGDDPRCRALVGRAR